ncbi:MAG: prepilin-type N-terminal cleavage/methylation domain-containing protein [Gemmatimonadota bacterium]
MNHSDSKLAPRDGFTLVEVVVAMMILSVVMVSLAGLTFQTAQRAISSQGIDQRQAVMMQQANMLAAVPYDSLGNYTGCTTVTTPFAYTRCVTMTTPVTDVRRMTVIVTPTMNNKWAPDTMQVEKSKKPVNPLNMT